ncbi:MAG: hypothetical protein ACMUIP_08050 [bacterium]
MKKNIVCNRWRALLCLKVFMSCLLICAEPLAESGRNIYINVYNFTDESHLLTNSYWTMAKNDVWMFEGTDGYENQTFQYTAIANTVIKMVNCLLVVDLENTTGWYLAQDSTGGIHYFGEYFGTENVTYDSIDDIPNICIPAHPAVGNTWTYGLTFDGSKPYTATVISTGASFEDYYGGDLLKIKSECADDGSVTYYYYKSDVGLYCIEDDTGRKIRQLTIVDDGPDDTSDDSTDDISDTDSSDDSVEDDSGSCFVSTL